MDKNELLEIDALASNQLAINWIASGNKDALISAFKKNNLCFSVNIFYGLLRSGNLNWIEDALLYSKRACYSEIRYAVLSEKVYNEDEWDELLIKCGCEKFASNAALERHGIWQILIDKGRYNILARNADAHPELWEVIDKNADRCLLFEYKRIDALVKRKFFSYLLFIEGGAEIIIKNNGAMIAISNLYPVLLKERLEKEVKLLIDHLIEAGREKVVMEYFSGHYLAKLGYTKMLVEAEDWDALYKGKKYGLIDWNAWFHQENCERRRRFVYGKAKEVGYHKKIKKPPFWERWEL